MSSCCELMCLAPLVLLSCSLGLGWTVNLNYMGVTKSYRGVSLILASGLFKWLAFMCVILEVTKFSAL